MNAKSAELTQKFIALLHTKEPPSLGPEPRPSGQSITALNQQFDKAALPTGVPPLIRALVLLWRDHLDEAHTICQDISSADGSFIHAIVHRREPDYWNSKYWFNRVGTHPAFVSIARDVEILNISAFENLAVKLIPGGKWNSHAFVDLCEQFSDKAGSPPYQLLQQIQQIESRALLRHLCEGLLP